MSKQTNTSRRKFLQGAAYASALSVGGLSGLAAASSANTKQHITDTSGIPSSTVTLSNQSAKTVALDAKHPIILEEVNGWVVVKVNKASATGSTQTLNLEAGQQLSYVVGSGLAPRLASGQQHRTSGQTVFVSEDNFPASLYNAAIS